MKHRPRAAVLHDIMGVTATRDGPCFFPRGLTCVISPRAGWWLDRARLAGESYGPVVLGQINCARHTTHHATGFERSCCPRSLIYLGCDKVVQEHVNFVVAWESTYVNQSLRIALSCWRLRPQRGAATRPFIVRPCRGKHMMSQTMVQKSLMNFYGVLSARLDGLAVEVQA